jgi:serine/threonine protein kinase
MDHLVRAVARIDSAPLLVPGQILDLTYELVERIGGGGMGVVYRARDQRLGRDVAVKVLRNTGGPADEDMRRLFEREARATAQLVHPNIVTLLHVGEHDGHPYLVLELLSGETLAARLARRGRLPVEEALNILDSVLAALAFAHEHGMLHRDLKPNNVFITGDERIKVLDFGVALSLDMDSGPITRAAGTPGYMAPEQRDGSTAQDARTDVWAAAQLLLECLLGRLTSGGSISDVDAPDTVRQVLTHALAADPADRPSSARELRIALARASGRLSQAVAVPTKWRHRGRLAALCIVSALVGGVIVERMRYPVDTDEIGAPPTIAEMNTSWESRFGILELHVDNDGHAYGVYEHDNGVLAGSYYHGVLAGWWCEEPTRRPPNDAGLVQMLFIRSARRILIDGQWKYGDDPKALWIRDWNGVSVEKPPVPELEQRMQRHVTCPPLH